MLFYSNGNERTILINGILFSLNILINGNGNGNTLILKY